MAGRFQELRQQARDIWSRPDAYVLDAGSSTELGIAKIRLAVTSCLLVFPLINLFLLESGDRYTHLTVIAVTLIGVLVALVAYELVLRGHRRPWLPLVTSLVDVSLVTLALVGYSFTIDPHQAVNSKITFEIYFLAIGATCLRYDARVSAIAGIVAILEYIGVVALVTATYDLNASHYAPWIYGQFFWSDQVSRVFLLLFYSALCTGIVVRLHRHRLLSNSDRLTGLFNRAFFDDFLAGEIRRAKRYDHPFAIGMIDLDRFKLFNDTYGHAAGDEALKIVANAIRLGGRGSDLVARYGGEEIVVVMPETTLVAARRRLESIREAVAAESIAIPTRRESIRITVSAGVACWPEDGDNPEDLLHIADARLFHAKAMGRNRVVFSSIASESV